MLVKITEGIRNYIIDSNNKKSILRIVQLFQYGFDYELVDAKSGGYVVVNKFNRELVLLPADQERIYRNARFNFGHCTIQTEYGKYACSELSSYVHALEVFNTLKEYEKAIKEFGALESSGLQVSKLPFFVPEEKDTNTVNLEFVAGAKKALDAIGVDVNNISDDESVFLYKECIHDFGKIGKLDIDALKYHLIDKGELEKSREKYSYMKNEYPAIVADTIAKAKKDYEQA